ncbi:MAG: beta-galactosidase [Acidobacteria bacterium]|nr:beta-galactosidase [Acidobacteriota bacterium]
MRKPEFRVCVFGLLFLLLGATVPSAFLPSAPAEDTGKQIEFGADYYAEDYPPDRIGVDARLMREAGFRTVRLVDTNWERLEPEEGGYDLAWLDRVIRILNEHGIRAILGTSSYVPPAWLAEKHPDFYAVNKEGVRYRWGGMGFMCLHHPVYRSYVEKLVTALAAHYGNHPGVIGWQVDNELGTWGYACYDTQYCLPKFRQYLQGKFNSLEELNTRWRTVSYGHRYSSWSQIPLNWTLGMQAHQAPLELEAQRFFSRNVAEFLDFQARIIRPLSSKKFITHNLSGPSRNGDAFQWAPVLDFISYDSYPRVGEHVGTSFALDLVRGFNRGKPFLILEHRSGTTGPFTLSDAAPPPGLIRLWAWQTIAHGADGALFFRWRTSIGGSEQYWQGLLNYDGTPGPTFPEVARMGKELETLGAEIAGTPTGSPVAGIMSFDSLWALHVGDASFPYFELLNTVHHGFKRLGLNVDFVEPQADLSRYKVVFAPTLHVLDQETVDNLRRFVESGGVLILTARSGVKTPDNLAVEQPLPGLLRALAGVQVSNYTLLREPSMPRWFGFDRSHDDYRSESENIIESVSPQWPGTYRARVWADIIEPESAQTLFRYTKDFYGGKAAATIAKVGKGKVVYVGSLLEPRFYYDLAKRACEWAGVPTIQIPEGVDFAVRQDGDRKFLFLLNFSPTVQSLNLPGRYQDVLSNGIFDGTINLRRLDLVILADDTSTHRK